MLLHDLMEPHTWENASYKVVKNLNTKLQASLKETSTLKKERENTLDKDDIWTKEFCFSIQSSQNGLF